MRREEPLAVCSFSLNPTSATSPVHGGSATIAVTASAPDCPRTAVSNSPFIAIFGGDSDVGSGIVTYNVAVNKTIRPRTGTLTVAGLTFTVTQIRNRRLAVDFDEDAISDIAVYRLGWASGSFGISSPRAMACLAIPYRVTTTAMATPRLRCSVRHSAGGLSRTDPSLTRALRATFRSLPTTTATARPTSRCSALQRHVVCPQRRDDGLGRGRRSAGARGLQRRRRTWRSRSSDRPTAAGTSKTSWPPAGVFRGHSGAGGLRRQRHDRRGGLPAVQRELVRPGAA